jgi:hypothetical protein
MSLLAQKRTRLNTYSAVITGDDYAKSLNEVEKLKKEQRKKPSALQLHLKDHDTNTFSNQPQPISLNSFVVLHLWPTLKKTASPVFYVGQVVSEEPARMWRIKCMRRYRRAVNQFIFPDQDDIDTYSYDEVVKVLSVQQIVRSVYHFQEDELMEYSFSMR